MAMKHSWGSWRAWRFCCKVLFWAGISLWAGHIGAEDDPANVELVGVMGGSKAILAIDGAAPRTMSPGQVYRGVKLVSVRENSATVTINGKPRTVRIGQNLVMGAPAGSESGATAVIMKDTNGHFQTSGSINGHGVKFLVDTGATSVSMGASDAQRMKLDLSKAEPIASQTANGVVKVFKLKLRSVKVGDIELHDVDGVVHPTVNMPQVLLGMSFISRVQMKHEGDMLIFRQRF
ncbi:MAG: TIGR02281 family clan AA aspartic protease [Zoogloeaceae bacterium]|nr:TIGR02281 family clan AA aspartic protease [Zoogloeaceae bacterium]